MAHFEVYILNYNGAHYLTPCLESLQRVSLGSHSMTVNVVDNGSVDPSEAVVRGKFPEVNYVPLGFNYGFSKGNNLGVQARVRELAAANTRADFHVLLNSDTEVHPNWLCGAAEAFADPKVGIVGSKAIFRDRFAVVRIKALSPFVAQAGAPYAGEELGIFLHTGYAAENLRTEPGRIKLPDAYSRFGHGCWLKPDARVFLPVIDPKQPASYSFYLENHHPELKSVKVLLITQKTCREVEIERNRPARLTLELSPDEYREVVQNAGSFVTRDWYAGDRGFLEFDEGQYDTACEVDSICGVSMFVRAELWDTLGGFDEHYFAYYEDADLSLRARLLGWRCVYAPASSLLHVHAGSGVEHSDYFNRNVACSHLIFASKLMNAGQWRRKRRESRKLAFAEFQAFKADHSLAGKPHLTAYCRYLKALPTFTANRITRLRTRPAKRLFAAANAAAPQNSVQQNSVQQSQDSVQ